MLSVIDEGGLVPAHGPSSSHQTFDLDSVRSLVDEDETELRIHYVDSIGSTMNVAVWAKEHAIACSPGLVLIAGEQPEGIGYKGHWRSVPHKDVMMTLALNDVMTLKDARLVQFASALAVCQSLELVMRSRGIDFSPFNPRPFVIKYPNDVYAFTSQGYKKICGSMCIGSADAFWKSETSLRTGLQFPRDVALLGIGINLATTSAPADYAGPPRVSFQELTGELIIRETVISRTLGLLRKSLAELRRNPDEFVARIVPYLSVCAGSIVQVDYRDSTRISESLTFREVAPDAVVFQSGEKILHVPHEDIERIYSVVQNC